MALEYGSARIGKQDDSIRHAIKAAGTEAGDPLVGPRVYCSRWGCGLCCLACRRHVTQTYAEKCQSRAQALPTSIACAYCSRVLVPPPQREGVDG